MAKYKIYAVGYGINPDTKEPVYGIKCDNWPDCQKYIKEVTDAKYKGFLTDDEADAWIQKIKEEILIKKDIGVEVNPNPAGHSNPDTSDWQNKADKVYAAKLHPVDQDFMLTCQNLGLSIHDTEHMIKKMFVDVVKYLEDNGCINELPFN